MRKVTVVFTGTRYKSINIEESVRHVKKIFKDCETILSTNDAEFAKCVERKKIFDKTILILDDEKSLPGIKFSDAEQKNNINKQIQTAYRGIKEASNNLVLRLRTDHQLISDKILSFWHLSESINSESNENQGRIITSALFSINPRYMEKMAWHISDMFQFGYKEDLLKYFSAPYYTEEYAIWYEKEKHSMNANWYELNFRSKYAVEQWLALHYIFSKEEDFPINKSHNINETIIAEFENTWPIYFFIIHPYDLGLLTPKFKSSMTYCNTQCYTTIDSFILLDLPSQLDKDEISFLLNWKPSMLTRLLRNIIISTPVGLLKKILSLNFIKRIRKFVR